MHAGVATLHVCTRQLYGQVTLPHFAHPLLGPHAPSSQHLIVPLPFAVTDVQALSPSQVMLHVAAEHVIAPQLLFSEQWMMQVDEPEQDTVEQELPPLQRTSHGTFGGHITLQAAPLLHVIVQTPLTHVPIVHALAQLAAASPLDPSAGAPSMIDPPPAPPLLDEPFELDPLVEAPSLEASSPGMPLAPPDVAPLDPTVATPRASMPQADTIVSASATLTTAAEEPLTWSTIPRFISDGPPLRPP